MIDGEMKMQEKQDGFVVPAGGEHVLEPGADHVMVMNMTDPVLPGDEVEITLEFDDGTTYTYAAQGREAEVGDEEYVPSDDHGDMSDDG
jgi:copper(I)-binding protein